MKAFVKFSWLALGLCVSAQAEIPTCFSTHLKEAIKLNTARAPLYAFISGGDSRELSKQVIFSERLSVIPAKVLEWRAKSFWKAGIRVLCEDFVSMATTPAFKERFNFEAPRLVNYRAPDVRRWKDDLAFTLRHMSFAVTHATAMRLLKEVAQPRGFNCMSRHVLDSIARVAYLAPQYEALAEKKGLRSSPAYLSRAVLWLHLEALTIAEKMDREASKLQARGLPILCQDVPQVDLTPVLTP